MTTCEGCTSYDRTCRGDKSTSNIACPCQSCLVKTMCHKPCEEFKAFEDYLHKRDLIYVPSRIRRAADAG